MRRIHRAVIGGLIFALLDLSIYVFQPGGERGFKVLSSLTFVLAAMGAALACWYTWQVYEPNEKPKKVWRLLALGLSLWALSEAHQAFYEAVLSINTPPVWWGDVAWLIGYIPLFRALIHQYRILGVPLDRNELLILGLSFGIVLILTLQLVLLPIFTYAGYDRTLEQYLATAYPIGDLLLTFSTLTLALLFGRGALAKPWQLIVVGFAAMTVANLGYSYLAWHEMYVSGGDPLSNVVDFEYLLGYLFIALGAYYQRVITEGS